MRQTVTITGTRSTNHRPLAANQDGGGTGHTLGYTARQHKPRLVIPI